MRSTLTGRHLVAAVALALAASVATVPVRTPASAAAVVVDDQKVMSINYCGTKCNDGKYNPAIVPYVKSYHPGVLFLTEVCRHQAASVAADSDWFTSTYFIKKRDVDGACGEVGDAILTHKAQTDRISKVMPVEVDGVKDAVSCATVAMGAEDLKTVLCVTHLDVDDANAKRQLLGTSSWQGAAGWANDRANGKPLIFAGDFNLTPTTSAITQVKENILEYGTQATGQHYQRLDALNQPTRGSTKIDYVFFKSSYAKDFAMHPDAPNNLGNPPSDHYLLYGTADLCTADAVC